jgi:uncharacterized SAM-binding protein YcdF (DUF218 family)
VTDNSGAESGSVVDDDKARTGAHVGTPTEEGDLSGGGLAAAGSAKRRRRRGWRIILMVLLSLVLAFTEASLRLFIFPTEGMPPHADAIVMFLGSYDRLGTAVRLAEEDRAPVLVVSQGRGYYGGPCPANSATLRAKIICFAPDPPNTRGEAEFVGRLAKRYHWRSIALVTTRFQVTRARLTMSKCFDGPIYAVSSPVRGVRSALYGFTYEWGALIKALLLRQPC